MTKRILSILLSVIIMLSGFSAFAAPVSESVDTSLSDLEFMKKLGAFPDDLHSGDALTRGELAKIYFRIMMSSQADAEYVDYASAFSDVDGADFPANFVASVGIMNGVGGGMFNPSGTLTYAEIVKTLVNFMGYRVHAEENGGYPAGYLYYGALFGFNKLAPSNEKAVVTTDIAAGLFKQAMNTGMATAIYKGDGAVYTNKEGRNYAETYMDIYRTEGVITATYVENIRVTDDKETYFGVQIDGESYKLTADNYSMNNLLGYGVEVFYTEKSDGTKEIILYNVTDTSVITVTDGDFAGADVDGRKLYYYNDNGKKKSVDISDAYVIYNGALCESYGENVLNPFADTTSDSLIKLIDNDGDTEIDVVTVESYKNYVVTKIVDGKIFNKYLPSTVFDIEDIQDGDIPVKNVLGNTVSLSTLEEKDIISVYTDLDGNVTKIIVSVDSYVGEVVKIEHGQNNAPSVQIDNVVYECANSITDPLNKEFPKLEVGQTVKVYFNFDGKISDVEISEYTTEKVGYLVDATVTKKPLDDTVMVKILTAKGSMLISPLAENVKLNGEKKTDDFVLSAFGTVTENGAVKRQPVKYTYDNENDRITEMWVVDDSIDQYSEGFYQYKGLDPNDLDYYRSSNRSFAGKLLLSASTKVFLVPDEDGRYADENYSVTDSTYYPDGDIKDMPTFVAYGSKAYCPVAEALVVQTVPTDFYTLGDVLFVTGCTKELNGDAEMVRVFLQNLTKNTVKSRALDSQ